MVRYGLWVAALIGAHLPRGDAHFEADVARAFGLAVVPGVLQALRAALSSLEASERRLRSLVQNSRDVITVVGGDLLIRWQADSIKRVLGHKACGVVGQPMLDLIHRADRDALDEFFTEATGRPAYSQTISVRVRHARGDYRHMEIAASNRLHDASVRGFVLNMRDATERLRLEQDLRELAAEREHDALHDALTGLANRRQLLTRLDQLLAQARAERREFGLLLIDLDHFKEVNDTLGHHAGDELLRELRPRLCAAAPRAELVARLGGDEFAVLLRSGTDQSEAERTAEALRSAISQPFEFQGLTLLVRGSLGLAMYPEHGEDVETLMQRADIAMYSAKSRGVGLEVYSASRDGHSKERLALIGELPEAIEEGQIVVHYQPKVDLRTDTICGAEALVRWAHPRHGLLGPESFLSMAEQIGLMRPLTLHVLDRALAECAQWQAQGLAIDVAVNLSAPNLLDLALPKDVGDLLEKWAVEPSHLQLEITETIVAADPVRVRQVLQALRLLGVRLSLDDFGTGSSSLSFLRELPVQELKIDKSFIAAMDSDDQAAAIVRTIVELAHNLGLRAVAEGIETDAVRERLTRYGCDIGQGFLLGRGLPAEDLTARMDSESSALLWESIAMAESRSACVSVAI